MKLCKSCNKSIDKPIRGVCRSCYSKIWRRGGVLKDKIDISALREDKEVIDTPDTVKLANNLRRKKEMYKNLYNIDRRIILAREIRKMEAELESLCK